MQKNYYFFSFGLTYSDLSRFGRDYIETGIYIERIFPSIDVRFIAINERFDSFATDKSNEALMIPLQNMINSLYAKDISKKISSAFQLRMQQGELCNGHLPYGYLWDEERTKIIIDEVAAPYVKLLFQWKIEGITIEEMIRRLADLQAPKPTFWKNETGARNFKSCHSSPYQWSRSTISGILTNQIYIGDTVLGKTTKALYKGINKSIRNDKESYFVFENTHEAIISKEDYERVTLILKSTADEVELKMKESEKMRSNFIDFFVGKIFCGDCDRKMYYKRHQPNLKIGTPSTSVWRASYSCSTNVRKLQPSCTAHTIQEKKLHEKILQAIKTQAKLGVEYEQLLAKLQGSEGEKSVREKQNNVIHGLKLKLSSLHKKRIRLYEDFADGILDQSEYLYTKEKFDEDYARCNDLLEEMLTRQRKFIEAMSSENQWVQLMKSVSRAKKLTQGMADAVIEKIYVYDGGKIGIVMKYEDIFDLMIDGIKEIREVENARSKE